MNSKAWIGLFVVLHFGSTANAQSVEYFAGNERTGADLMWFKNFLNKQDTKTSFLFFSRNRVSVDYHDSPGAFGSTNAISYNFNNGIGIVSVASFLNTGFTPKTGIQYFRQKNAWLFFGWIVSDLEKAGNADLFGMLRYQPKINDHWQVFTQLELFPVLTPSSGYWNVTQRVRLGLKHHRLAGGFMLDLNQQGKNQWTNTHNTGGFLRYEF